MFDWILISVSGLTASLSFLLTVLSIVKEGNARRKKMQNIKEEKYKHAISTFDVRELRKYLEEDIGKFDVSEYVSKDSVADSIDIYIAKIQRYICTDEQLGAEDKRIEDSKIDVNILNVSTGSDNRELEKVNIELQTGEVWNALAQLRRFVEIQLRAVCESVGLRENQMKGAGQMLRLLRNRKLVDETTSRRLEYAIHVCNQAIHGREVTVDQGFEALAIVQGEISSLRPV